MALGKYDIYKTLGSGGFAKVKLGIHSETEQPVALKIMKRSDDLSPAFIDLVKTESKVLETLDHKNIIKLYQLLEDE